MYRKCFHHNATASLTLLSLSDLLLHRYLSSPMAVSQTAHNSNLRWEPHGRSKTSSRDGQGSPLQGLPQHHLPDLPGRPPTNRPPSINQKGGALLEDPRPATHQRREGGNTKGDSRKPCKVGKGQSKSMQRGFAKRREENKLQQQSYNADFLMLKLPGEGVSKPGETLWAIFSANVKTTGAQILKGFRRSGDG